MEIVLLCHGLRRNLQIGCQPIMIKFNSLLQTQFMALSLKGGLPCQIREVGERTLGHARTQKDNGIERVKCTLRTVCFFDFTDKMQNCILQRQYAKE